MSLWTGKALCDTLIADTMSHSVTLFQHYNIYEGFLPTVRPSCKKKNKGLDKIMKNIEGKKLNEEIVFRKKSSWRLHA